MKKLNIMLGVLLVAVAVTHAEPRFGGVADMDGGAGIYVTDDMYTGSLKFSNTSSENDNGTTTLDSSETNIEINANLKQPLTSQTALTYGLGFTIISGEVNDVDIDSASSFALNVGIEHEIVSNLLFVGQFALAEFNRRELDNNTETTSTEILNGGTFGLAYVF